MATHQSHISFSTFLGIMYAFVGIYLMGIYPEHALLASVLVIVAGMLPDIDNTGGSPAREVGGLLAAVAPLVVLEFFPAAKTGGVARIALVVVCSYLITRIFIVRALHNWTTYRGMVHSVPAAIITFELVYLLFWDMYWRERLFVASAAFLGYFSHLLLDAYDNFDLIGRAVGNAKKKEAALKFASKNKGATVLAYGCMLFLGYFVIRDFYPGLTSLSFLRY